MTVPKIPRPTVHAILPAACVVAVALLASLSCPRAQAPVISPAPGLPSTLTSPDFRGFGVNTVNVGTAETVNTYQFAVPLTLEQERLYEAIENYNRKSK